ncbi:hypothetical protein HOT99_gp189 [Caulobacter phage CcrBL10]|uniref:Uncharacterized protein n=1 Tax=Caulobacter phage CcrBL10 TaxID=2283269 RepID=A0A385ECG1_9CAUD|nr:hypothetical protein HOT99_gp189 [Caulobacter phage CcrBL10]AXQ68428.1 hypothetical protein CcrBL10_gp224 [Caulobacter phage CcrBL10]
MITTFLRCTHRDAEGRRYLEFREPDLVQRLYVRKPADDWTQGYPIVLEDFYSGSPGGKTLFQAGKRRGCGIGAFFRAYPEVYSLIVLRQEALDAQV